MTCTNCIHKDVCYKIEHYGRDLDGNEPCEHFLDSTKMIPKVPVLDHTVVKGFSGLVKTLHCPNCYYDNGTDLEDIEDYKYEYCPRCSQALDRSGEDGN